MRLFGIVCVFLTLSLSAKSIMKEFKITNEFHSYLHEMEAVKTVDIYSISLEFDGGDEVFVRVQGKTGEEKFNKVVSKRFQKGKSTIPFEVSLFFKSTGGEECSNITELSYRLQFTYSRLKNDFSEEQKLVVNRQVLEQCIPPFDAVNVSESQQFEVEVSPLLDTPLNNEGVNDLNTYDVETSFIISDEHDELLKTHHAPKEIKVEELTIVYKTAFYVFVHLEGSIDKNDISGIHKFSKRNGRITKAIHAAKTPSMHGYCGSVSDFVYRLSFLLNDNEISDLNLNVSYQDLVDACHPPFEPKQELNVVKFTIEI